ncbi:hypothetical protein EDB80DRAFT_693882 [Ilyonectria destructans]|nr:hypothetical protein EDB80DRAFT_693882 [Ilyonectria destructans]
MAASRSEMPPILSVTLLNTILAATSSLLAQALTWYRTNQPLIIDWAPVAQFIIWTIISTPPNYLWQDYLEQTFPAYHAAAEKARRSDDKAVDGMIAKVDLVEPKFNVRNALVKTMLDQTAGAAVNTFLFSVFIHALKAAMTRPAGLEASGQTVAFSFSGSVVDYDRVDWSLVLARAQAEFFPLLMAGWKLWPAVSLINFVFIKTVEGRNLLSGLAGVGWGIYMSLFATE